MRLECYSYQLPFGQPFKTRNRTYYHREGFIFCLSGPAFHSCAEAAPLPGFSRESAGDTRVHIRHHINDWKLQLQTDQPIRRLQEYFQKKKTPPALQFGLDALAYQQEARAAGTAFSSLLPGKAAPKIVVNGLISLTDAEEDPISSVKTLTKNGFGTIKCKVGSDALRERKLLTQIRKRFPGLRIRLDANRGWTLNEAVANLKALESTGIEYCEEPLSQPSRDSYRELSRQTEVPLALDETVNKNQDWEQLLPFCEVLIVKPMVIGSFTRLFSIHKQAETYGCSLVFTSSLESSIGRTITAILASALGSTDHAHGLNTGSLLGRDITAQQPEIRSGTLYLNDLEPIVVDKDHLKEAATHIISST